ncbi:hypothetical protein EJB05_00637 [Eragrostis curvula]|uniref:Uncharacterized protein n=1 Tax=Eragrostis curvula TaxID=38414 RepID=A0A5J9WMD1_9POAL|nr:hypothetical protein EJB05_00637 [Eragrostis curvula]
MISTSIDFLELDIDRRKFCDLFALRYHVRSRVIYWAPGLPCQAVMASIIFGSFDLVLAKLSEDLAFQESYEAHLIQDIMIVCLMMKIDNC